MRLLVSLQDILALTNAENASLVLTSSTLRCVSNWGMIWNSNFLGLLQTSHGGIKGTAASEIQTDSPPREYRRICDKWGKLNNLMLPFTINNTQVPFKKRGKEQSSYKLACFSINVSSLIPVPERRRFSFWTRQMLCIRMSPETPSPLTRDPLNRKE